MSEVQDLRAKLRDLIPHPRWLNTRVCDTPNCNMHRETGLMRSRVVGGNSRLSRLCALVAGAGLGSIVLVALPWGHRFRATPLPMGACLPAQEASRPESGEHQCFCARPLGTTRPFRGGSASRTRYAHCLGSEDFRTWWE